MTRLSSAEQTEVDSRIEQFYGSKVTDQKVMNERVPKWGLGTDGWIHPRQHMALSQTNASALSSLAGVKATDKFQKGYCQQVLKTHFPALYAEHCVPKSNALELSTVEGNDKVDFITQGWMAPEKVAYHLDYIPTVGKTDMPLWSDDYWKTRWGLTSYRYSEHKQFATYNDAVNHYAQPVQWTSLLQTPIGELAKQVVYWSPAEKYDLTVGDETFALTNQQKGEGKSMIGADGNVEVWMGICHGWAAAAITVPPPNKAITVVGAKGMNVTWYPSDLKALASLTWANGTYVSNYVGGRCNNKTPEILANGRIKDQRCFDNNPAAFHLSLGNMIGKEKLSFVMDKTFDYEVWNQPVHSYEFTYFNPMNPSQKSKNWKEVTVDYSPQFRAQDRFQNPPTRGLRTTTGYDDKNVRKVVGVIATVVYLVEVNPGHSPTPDKHAFERVSYTYDLEFHEHSGELYPMGGEWHQNAHPDFLWVPRKGSFAKSNYDNVKLEYNGAAPSTLVTETARAASSTAMPLCRVVKELVKRGSDNDVYPCP